MSGAQAPHPIRRENRCLQLGSWESDGLKFYHIAAEYLYGLVQCGLLQAWFIAPLVRLQIFTKALFMKTRQTFDVIFLYIQIL